MKRRSSIAEPSRHAKRRGVMFHYYMMYLFLSSVLLTTSGLCIHSILQADNTDTRLALYLKTLLRIEGSLRQDAETTTAYEIQPDGITLLNSTAEQRVRWSAKDNVVRRELINGDETVAADRFVFPRGTTLEFTGSGPRIVFTVHEPSPIQTTTGGGESASPGKSVQMIIVLAATEGED